MSNIILCNNVILIIIIAYFISFYINYIYIFSNASSTNLNMTIKYQSYLTQMFYETNIGSAFYDNIRLGVIY